MKHVCLHLELFYWVVINLIEPYLGKGRDVSTEKSILYGPAKQLRQKKTNIVGTVNKVGRELFPSAKTTRYSSVLTKASDVATLTINQCEPKKCLCS